MRNYETSTDISATVDRVSHFRRVDENLRGPGRHARYDPRAVLTFTIHIPTALSAERVTWISSTGDKPWQQMPAPTLGPGRPTGSEGHAAQSLPDHRQLAGMEKGQTICCIWSGRFPFLSSHGGLHCYFNGHK